MEYKKAYDMLSIRKCNRHSVLLLHVQQYTTKYFSFAVYSVTVELNWCQLSVIYESEEGKK